jgi:hypothetical protein
MYFISIFVVAFLYRHMLQQHALSDVRKINRPRERVCVACCRTVSDFGSLEVKQNDRHLESPSLDFGVC